jgi:hypothetical protein
VQSDWLNKLEDKIEEMDKRTSRGLEGSIGETSGNVEMTSFASVGMDVPQDSRNEASSSTPKNS